MGQQHRFLASVPAGSFLRDYLEFMDPQETPYAYDFWTGVWLLGVAIGRDCFVARPRAPVYMNWYIILAAESGVTRKSTAVRFATRLARMFREDIGEHELMLVERKTTPEQLEAILHNMSEELGYAHAAISISELVTFLGRERYNMQMPGLLTDLYDCPRLQSGPGTITRGPTLLKNVFLSFLSASTPSWLNTSVNSDVVEGGFTSRCIFVVSERRKRRVAWPTETSDGSDDRRARSLADQLVRIRREATSVGGIGVSSGGLDEFTRWYNERAENSDAFRASFESREDAHILRMAGALAANEGSWLIRANHIKTAARLITEVKESGAIIFRGTGEITREVRAVDKIRNTLVEADLQGVYQPELNQLVRHLVKADFVETVLWIMHELGMVQRFENVKRPANHPATLWRGKQELVQRNALGSILDRIDPNR